MSNHVMGIDEFDDKPTNVIPDLGIGQIRLENLPPKERLAVEGTIKASAAIGQTARPSSNRTFFTEQLFNRTKSPLASKVTEPPLSLAQVQDAAATTGLVSSVVNNPLSSLIQTIGPQEGRKLADVFDSAKNEVTALAASAEEAAAEGDLSLMTKELVIEEVVENQAKQLQFPNVAQEAVYLGLAMERHLTESRLHVYENEVREHHASISQLLALNAKLQKLSPEKGHTLSDEVVKMLEELKAKKIDLLPDMKDGKISQNELMGAKESIKSHIDQLRTKIQGTFSTKINVVLQFMNSMFDAIKNALRSHDRAMGTMTRNQRANG